MTLTMKDLHEMDHCSGELPFYCCHNHMCYGLTEFCDHRESKIQSCFPEMNVNALLSWCKLNHANVSAYPDGQCAAACYLKFPELIESTNDASIWNWLTVLFAVIVAISVCLNIVFLAKLVLPYIASALKQSQENEDVENQLNQLNQINGETLQPTAEAQIGNYEIQDASEPLLTRTPDAETILGVFSPHPQPPLENETYPTREDANPSSSGASFAGTEDSFDQPPGSGEESDDDPPQPEPRQQCTNNSGSSTAAGTDDKPRFNIYPPAADNTGPAKTLPSGASYQTATVIVSE